jgi:hypothetical protein
MRQDEGTVTQTVTRYIAYHEAGHAVAAAVLRRRLESVSIVPQGDTGGVTILHRPRLPPGTGSASMSWLSVVRYSQARRDELVATLAGPVASRVYARAGTTLGADSDVEEAAKLARFLCPKTMTRDEAEREMNDTLSRAQTIATLLVRGYWPAVRTVAGVLLTESTMSGRRVRAIVRELPKVELPPLFMARRSPRPFTRVSAVSPGTEGAI